MTETFYTVEIPHQRRAEVTEWPSKQDAVIYYLNLWWANSPHYDLEPTTEAEVFEWAGQDLHSFRTCDSLEELRRWSMRYDEDGGHQRLTVLAEVDKLLRGTILERLLEEMRARGLDEIEMLKLIPGLACFSAEDRSLALEIWEEHWYIDLEEVQS